MKSKKRWRQQVYGEWRAHRLAPTHIYIVSDLTVFRVLSLWPLDLMKPIEGPLHAQWSPPHPTPHILIFYLLWYLNSEVWNPTRFGFGRNLSAFDINGITLKTIATCHPLCLTCANHFTAPNYYVELLIISSMYEKKQIKWLNKYYKFDHPMKCLLCFFLWAAK